MSNEKKRSSFDKKTRLYSDASSDADLDFETFSDDANPMELVEEHHDVVTMKVIDFAHSTFEGFLDDDIIHEGPDRGFLKGIDSLLTLLQHFLCEEIW